MKEIWKHIEGYDGMYMVSNMGNVKSFKKWRGCSKERFLKQTTDIGGYLYVDLNKHGNKTRWMVHRLVLTMFVGVDKHKPHVNHKNGIKNDNRLSNIEWITQTENNRHAFRTGLNKGGAYGKFGKDNHLSKKIVALNYDGSFYKEFNGQREAERHTGVDQRNISASCRNKIKGCGGYNWMYKEDYERKM